MLIEFLPRRKQGRAMNERRWGKYVDVQVQKIADEEPSEN